VESYAFWISRRSNRYRIYRFPIPSSSASLEPSGGSIATRSCSGMPQTWRESSMTSRNTTMDTASMRRWTVKHRNKRPVTCYLLRLNLIGSPGCPPVAGCFRRWWRCDWEFARHTGSRLRAHPGGWCCLIAHCAAFSFCPVPGDPAGRETSTRSTRWPSMSTISKRQPFDSKCSPTAGTRPKCESTKPPTVS
jgi:hypothetical protein